MNELQGYYFEDLEVGMTASFAKTITEADIVNFAGVTGDFNPVHVNEEYAMASRFHRRIAHGMLTAGLISTVLGTHLPGPGAIYVSQDLKFHAPVFPGDTVHAEVAIHSIDPASLRVVMETRCRVKGRDVLTGEAVILVPSKTE